MSDFYDDLDEEEEAVRREILRRARSEGVKAAYESALRICQDPKAPAQAVSNASRTLLQVGSLLDRADRKEDSVVKEPHEMSSAELHKAAAKAQRDILRRAAKSSEAGVSDTVEDAGAFD